MRDVLKRIGSVIRRAGANSELAVDTGFGGAGDRLIEVVAHSHRAGVAAADLQALASAYALTVRRPSAETGEADAAADEAPTADAVAHSDATIDAVDQILSDTPDIAVILAGLPSLQITDLVKVAGPIGEAARAAVDAERRAGRARPARATQPRATQPRATPPRATSGPPRASRPSRPRAPGNDTRTYRSWSRLVVGVRADLRHKRSGERFTVDVAELLGPALGRKRGFIDQRGAEYREVEYDVAFELPGAGDER